MNCQKVKVNMKFKNWFILIVLFLFQGISAQIKDPVKFKYQINSLANNEYEAVLTASIDKNWHIYSQDLPEDSGIPTEMKLSSKDGITLIGKVQEVGKKHDEFSEAFGAQIVYYSNSVLFKQKFKLKNNAKPANVTVEITYQTCDDRVCLAPNTLEFEQKVTLTAVSADTPTSSEEVIVPPISGENSDSVRTTDIAETTIVAPIAVQEGLKVASIDFENPQTDCGIAKQTNTENFWTYLLLGFFGGLIALLTPCVFPMIPLTVSFFTKGSKDKAKGKRDAILYGFFILLIFVLLSIPFHIID